MSPQAPAAAPASLFGVHRSTRWSTRIEVVVTEPSLTVSAARLLDDVLDRVEAVASRFRDDSEVCRLHRQGDRGPTPISPDLVELLGIALRAAASTDGAVDPTVGSALCALGYDRDFTEVAGGVDGGLPSASPVPGWQNITVDPVASTVSLPVGTLLDLGATAKAWAADRAAADIATQLGCGVLVSLGGDLAVRSAPVDGFVVGIADICGDPDAPTAVRVQSGGLATSGVGNRRWLLGTTPVHHVVDPSTGLPVETPWRTVTVAAASCVDANTASTASLVLGDGAPDWLGQWGLPARLVTHDGTVVTVAGWPDDDPGATADSPPSADTPADADPAESTPAVPDGGSR